MTQSAPASWCWRRRRSATSADASPRLVAELTGADLIAAEDTRRLRRLLERLGGRARTRGSCPTSRATRRARTAELVRALADGARVVVVTDAGMPSVSDPGYRLVIAAVDARHPGHGGARPFGGADRAGGVRAAGRPFLLRGLPAAQGRRAARRLDELAASRAPWCSSRHRTGRPRRWRRWRTPSAPIAGRRSAGS